MATLKKNVISLGMVQIFIYIIPLLQFPYLTRTLGVDCFGVVAYSLSLVQLANIITDYGFNLYLPQKILDKKNDESKIFSVTIYAKLILVIITITLYVLFVFVSKNYDLYFKYFFILLIAIISNGFMPIWFFISKEDLHIYSRIMIITKLSSLFFIYFLVDSPSDIYTLAWIYSLQALSVAFLLLSIVVIKYRIKIVVCSVDEVKKLLISSFPFFLSRVSASLYSSVCSIFLGYYSTSQVALYNAAEQLYKAGQQVFWPLNQALYPYMIRTKDYFVFIKIVFAAVIVSLFGVFVGIAYGADLLSIIFGAEFKNASDILSIFMLAILVNTIGSLIGYPALAPLGLSNIANKSVIYAGCVQILLLLFIGRYVDYIDGVIVAITVVVCELVVAFYRGKYLFEYGRKRGI